MKRYFLTLLLLLGAGSVFAQVGYGIGYIPTTGSGSSQNYSTSEESIYRTTAYSVNEQGYVQKLPIKVAVTSSAYGTSMRVSEYYDNSGYGGGTWRSVYSHGQVTKCSRTSVSHWGGSAELENNFMYKAQLGIAGIRTWYFDL